MRLLHIEDDPDIREITKMALEFQGDFEVIHAANGQAALSMLDEVQPDLFLVDMMMPGMSGAEVRAALRSTPGFEATPVIFMSARPLVDEHESLVDDDVLGVISKPFDPVTLSDRIQELLAGRTGPRSD